jgi:hypothetical protein
METVDELPPVGSTGDKRRNPKYDEVDKALKDTPGKWRKVVHVNSRSTAVKWYGAAKRKGWQVEQRRNGDGWDIWGRWGTPLIEVLNDNKEQNENP